MNHNYFAIGKTWETRVKQASRKRVDKVSKEGNCRIGEATLSNLSAQEMAKWPSNNGIPAIPVAGAIAVVGSIRSKTRPFAVVSAAADNGVPGELEKAIQNAKGIQRTYSYDRPQILHLPYLP